MKETEIEIEVTYKVRYSMHIPSDVLNEAHKAMENMEKIDLLGLEHRQYLQSWLKENVSDSDAYLLEAEIVDIN